MVELGNLSLYFSLILSSYAGIGTILGVRKRMPDLITSARYATYLIPLPLGLSVLSLVGSFVSRDFNVKYVAEHSSSTMPKAYAWVAFYAGNEGSILFIAIALSIAIAIAIALASRLPQDSLAYTCSVLMGVLTFFLIVLIFLANPFETSDISVSDGRGINPLLTHPGMFIHPPILMTGLVTVSIPFAFAMGSLLAKRTGDEWVDFGRTWALVSWGILGSGLLLGGWWAYTILGWGGFWAWDPVENAGFMPWLVLTAFVHSIMVQKRQGMFRVWNIALINIAFTSALLGMFINRGGPTPSVHSFAESVLGWIFLAFMVGVALTSFGLMFRRMPGLRNAQRLGSKLSRETAFLINNLLFLAVAFVIIWGQIFPVLSDAVTNVSITVAEPFYNRVNGPILLSIIFLMGIGPLIPWRHGSFKQLKRSLIFPFSIGLVIDIVLICFGMTKPFALISIGLCGTIIAGILREWFKGTRARNRSGESYPVAFVRLISANRPRYGGYVVHLAVVMMALAIVGTYFFDTQRDVRLSPGESVAIKDYTIRYLSAEQKQLQDHTESTATVEVYQDNKPLGILKPQQTFYPAFSIRPARAAIHSTLLEDLYIIPNDFFQDESVGFRILVNPLVMWLWIAGPVMVMGTMIALWPHFRVRGILEPSRSALIKPTYKPSLK